MRNLPTSGGAANRGRGAEPDAGFPLASPNQGRYKGVITAPGVVKFSAWKRENDIPKIFLHDYLLQKIRAQNPQKVFLKDVTLGRTETFGHFAESVVKVASGLTKIGFGVGDVMCMYCSNYVEYWTIALAAWSCGGCIMPTNCELDPRQLEDQLIEAEAKVLVCDDFNFEDALGILRGNSVAGLKHLIVVGSEGKSQGCIPASDLLEDDGKCPPPKVPDRLQWEKTTVYLPFTSSSSESGAKGVCHTHKSLLSWIYSPENAANHYLDQTCGDSLVCGNWFFHMTGFYTVALSAVYGISVYCLSEYSDAAFLDIIIDNKPYTAALYPWQIRLLSQSPSVAKYDLSCLRVIITGGGILSSTIRRSLLDRFSNVKVLREAYGTNETGIVTLTYPKEKKNSVSAAMASLELPDDHVMPVGLPNMYTHVKIRSRQSDENVEGPDEQGEICVKSPQCFTGYLGKDNARHFDKEGFFRTGDIGYYDSQGVIYFIEKIENMIHFWMYEVAPNILEARLLGSMNIIDAAVVGIPHKENGEVPRAFVVLRPGIEETEENLTNLMESRLEDHERIRGGLFFLESIPRDENWKVLKEALKEYKSIKEEREEETPSLEVGREAKDLLAASVGKSPKLAPKVKELIKQPNGAYVAGVEEDSEPSPRTGRRKAKNSLELPAPMETQDIFGLRSRSRRGSVAVIPEDSTATGRCSAESGVAANRRFSGGAVGRRGSADHAMGAGGGSGGIMAAGPALVGSGGTATGLPAPSGSFSYWMRVNVSPPSLEALLMCHPAVEDATVTGFHVKGIGHLPRAYVVIKKGYSSTAEEILAYANARLPDTDRLRGGLVLVEKLAKDPSGTLLVNLDKFDRAAVGVDESFIREQPKVGLEP